MTKNNAAINYTMAKTQIEPVIKATNRAIMTASYKPYSLITDGYVAQLMIRFKLRVDLLCSSGKT